jgi:hypothetical protein
MGIDVVKVVELTREFTPYGVALPRMPVNSAKRRASACLRSSSTSSTLGRLLRIALPASWAYYLVWHEPLDGAAKILAFHE